MLGQITLDLDAVSALAAMGKQRLVVGGFRGDLIVYKEIDGAELTQVFRAPRDLKQTLMVTGLSVCGEKVASVSRDWTVAIWDVENSSRMALLGGVRTPIHAMCVDMNDTLVVIGCRIPPYLRVLSVQEEHRPFITFGAVGGSIPRRQGGGNSWQRPCAFGV